MQTKVQLFKKLPTIKTFSVFSATIKMLARAFQFNFRFQIHAKLKQNQRQRAKLIDDLSI